MSEQAADHTAKTNNLCQLLPLCAAMCKPVMLLFVGIANVSDSRPQCCEILYVHDYSALISVVVSQTRRQARPAYHLHLVVLSQLLLVLRQTVVCGGLCALEPHQSRVIGPSSSGFSPIQPQIHMAAAGDANPGLPSA
jgi:hypothetical protein